MSSPILKVGPAPHQGFGASLSGHFKVQLLALAPALAAALYVHGWHALGVMALAAGSALVFEYVTERLFGQKVRVRDGSVVLHALLLAALLPPSFPWWGTLAGTLVMVVIGRQLYGGLGAYPFHPALVAWAMLALSWPTRVQPVGGELLGNAWLPAVALGGLALLVLGHLDWRAPLGAVIGVAGGGALLALFVADVPGPVELLLAGSVPLAIFFLIPEPTLCPSSLWPKFVFGVFAGLLIVVIRTFGIWAEPVPFALLLAEMAAPLIERLRPAAHRKVTTHA